MRLNFWRCAASRLLVVLAAAVVPAVNIHAATFYDNLAADNGGAETITGNRWLAGTFKTDAATYNALTATLFISQSGAGAAQLSLSNDGGLKPGSLVANFTSPASYSATPANTSFTLTGTSLSAGTSYWLVLRATSGSFNWSYTNDLLVANGWGDSPDAGSTWFGGNAFPFLYKVASGVQLAGDFNHDGQVDAADYVVWREGLGPTYTQTDYDAWKSNFGAGGAGAGATLAAFNLVPEPASIVMTGAALALVFAMSIRRRRSRGAKVTA